MWSLAKGYMERRNMCEVGYYCSWKYLKSIKIDILKCPNERKQSESETAFFYSLEWYDVIDVTLLCRLITDDIRISGDVAYCRSTFLLRIIMLQMCWKARFIVKDYKTLWNIVFFFVSMMTRLLSYRTIFSRLFHLSCIPLDFQEKHSHFHKLYHFWKNSNTAPRSLTICSLFPDIKKSKNCTLDIAKSVSWYNTFVIGCLKASFPHRTKYHVLTLSATDPKTDLKPPMIYNGVVFQCSPRFVVFSSNIMLENTYQGPTFCHEQKINPGYWNSLFVAAILLKVQFWFERLIITSSFAKLDSKTESNFVVIKNALSYYKTNYLVNLAKFKKPRPCLVKHSEDLRNICFLTVLPFWKFSHGNQFQTNSHLANICVY